MNTQAQDISPLRPNGRGVLVIGVGGLSSPALSVLVESGVRHFTLVDDDRVDETNLQRQTLFSEADVKRAKVEAAAERMQALEPRGEALTLELVRTRFTPQNALSLVLGHAIVLEGADNYATKFLAADAAKLAGVPVVQAGAVRLAGWALASLPQSGPCLRCVFEDIPRGQPETCAIAGVLGPVVGVLGALEAALTIQLLLGEERAAGVLWSYDATRGKLRKRRVARRADCPLCLGQITALDHGRYSNDCAA